MMKIGILETGEIHEGLAANHGAYPKMFERMLLAENTDFTFISVKVCRGEIPDSPSDADAWIISGSKFGVYEDIPWIAPLKQFIRECFAARIPIAGICFGHQILAEAMGGKVVKSDKGWGVGVHSYEINSTPSWMTGVNSSFAGHAVHQDQIVELPDNATVIACSEFCKNAALIYGEIENPLAISVQPHPEFEAPFIKDLIDVRLKGTISQELAKAAHQTLSTPVNNSDWARWISDFFTLNARHN